MLKKMEKVIIIIFKILKLFNKLQKRMICLSFYTKPCLVVIKYVFIT